MVDVFYELGEVHPCHFSGSVAVIILNDAFILEVGQFADADQLGTHFRQLASST